MGPVALSLWVVALAEPEPAPVVARPAAPVPYVVAPVPEPRSGKWMRLGGGLAVGLGAVLGVAALASYATTDGLDADDVEGRRSLEGVSLGLGIAAVAHLGAGIPVLVVGKQRQRRHAAWSRRVAWRFGAGVQGVRVGLTLRF